MPTFPTDLTVGQTGVDASLALQNKSTFPQDLGTSTICNFGDGGQFCGSDRGITLIPSCAKFDQDLRTCDAPDPGVFKLSATAVGADGSGCQARVFDVIEDDAALGRLRFTPQGGGRITLAPNATCVINFKIDVVKLPATDVAPDAGVQTNQLGSARFVSDVNTTPGQATGTAFGKTIKPPCTPPPGTPPPGGEQCPPPPPCTPPPGPPPPGGELCAPKPPPPPTPIVPGSTPVAPPLARISGKTGCVSKNFNVTVTGTLIRRVVYSLDGKRVRTLSRPNSGSRFVFRVKPGTLSTGVHRVVARTTFTSASGARPRDLRVTFSRCRRARQVPAFTG